MNLPNHKQNHFLANWYLATVIGMIAGSTVSLGFHSDWTFFMINLNRVTAIGLFISLTQWLVLQQFTSVKRWWLTSLLGFLIASILSGLVLQTTQGASISNQLYRSVYNFFEGAVIGFCAGVIQWLSVREFFTGFKSWIFASLLAWAFGLMIDRFQSYSIFDALLIPERIRWLLHTVIVCIPVSGFTGFAFSKLSNLSMGKIAE